MDELDELANEILSANVGEDVMRGKAHMENGKRRALENTGMDDDSIEKMLDALSDYRWIGEAGEIDIGSHIRYLLPGTCKLRNGGHVCKPVVGNSQMYLLCKNSWGRFFQVPVDGTLVFQRLTETEQLVAQLLQ